ncbi:hypothetical protein GQ457_10G027650 [Hibiscus cannabinus]
MSAITAIAKALFNMFFQCWNSPWSSSISFLLYSNCCVIFLLVIHLRFDGYCHILLRIIVSSCVNRVRTLKKKLIDSDVATLFSGFCNGTTLNSIGLVSGYGRPKIVGSNAKDKKVCTVELDPGEVPSLYESEEEEEEEEEQQQQQQQQQKQLHGHMEGTICIGCFLSRLVVGKGLLAGEFVQLSPFRFVISDRC